MTGMSCQEVDKFVHPYVDGEFAAAESVLLESHLVGCQRCRELVAFHSTFKANLRARLKRRVDPPPELARSITTALNRADGHRLRRMMPYTLIAAAAAALLIVFGARMQGAKAGSPIVEETVRAYEKNLPMEVGGTEEQVGEWMSPKVGVSVRPPCFKRVKRTRSGLVELVGGRVSHLRGREAAQLIYRVGASGRMAVWVFDPSGVELSAPSRRLIGGTEVHTGQVRGYNVALLSNNGVGYAFASDMAMDDMLHLVRSTLPDQSVDQDLD